MTRHFDWAKINVGNVEMTCRNQCIDVRALFLRKNIKHFAMHCMVYNKTQNQFENSPAALSRGR